VTRLTPRLRWRQAVASDAFPRSERVVRGTLLCLVELMSSTGELSVMREDITELTGLPARTVDRHLARAVAAGWLIHERHGSRGRRSLYLAHIPGEESAPEVARYSASGTGDSAPSTRGLTHRDSAPLGGALNKESANDSERVALDDDRGRRRAHTSSRANGDHDVTEQAAVKGSGQPTPSKCLSLLTRTEVA
jgi:hypothetical protein